MPWRGKAPGVMEIDCDLSIRPVASRHELEQAFNLVYLSFLQREYIEQSRSRMRFSVFNALPETVTFVGELRSQIVATVTLVPDTPIGLPMDEIYHEEVQALRDQGRRLAEVTMLADRRHEIRRALPVVMQLMKRILDYATLVLEANDICITINPRHETYYRHFLLFQSLGELKNYPSVRNNPALAQRLDLARVTDTCEGNERMRRHFMTNRTPLDELVQHYVMTPEDIEYFFVERTTMLQRLSDEHISYLRTIHPDCPWEEWLLRSLM
jgi:hypothetical protein